MHKEALQKSWKRTERSVRNSGAVAELALWECIRDWASPFKVPKATGATSSLLFCLFLPVYYHLSLNKTSSPSFFASSLVSFSNCCCFLHFSGYTLLSVCCWFSHSSSSPLGHSGPLAIQKFLVGFLWSGKRSTSCVDFSVLQCVTWPWVPLSKAPFLHAPLPQRVVSFPHDQHFCCLCFWLYLRSPSPLLCPSHSSRREQLCSVVEMFHWIFTSGVSFQTLQSATMELQRPEWLLLSAHS